MNNDFFVLPPTQEQFMPPIFKAGKIMTPAAMIWRSLLYDLRTKLYFPSRFTYGITESDIVSPG